MRLTFVLSAVLTLCSAMSVDAGLLLGSKGGVEVWSEPVESPGDGYLATEIYLKTSSEISNSARLVTLTNLSIDGGLVQSWQNQQPSPYLPMPSSEMSEFDSHLLLSREHVGGSAGYGFIGISETNDQTMDATTGFGGIGMQVGSDAFFLEMSHQGNELPLAKLVTTETADPVHLSIGVLGQGISNWPNGASFESIPVHFAAVPEPNAFLGMAWCAIAGLTWCRRRAPA